MFKLAAGYVPAFMHQSLIPDDVELVELGFGAAKALFSSASSGIDGYTGGYSCHFGRSPITDVKELQSKFIDQLNDSVGKFGNLISFGFHLSGPVNSNIGNLGFTSHYVPSISNERSAAAFLSRVREKTDTEVWLENANYYSSCGRSIIDVWHSNLEIAAVANCRLIVDLAHLVIDCRNSGVSPEIILGMIPWRMVAEVHLSGISIDANKRFHDGHALPVHHECWRLLDIIACELQVLNEDVYINIEHTDQDWLENKILYNADFEELRKLCLRANSNSMVTYDIDCHAVSDAKKYVKKKMRRIVSNLTEISEVFGVSEVELLDNWLTYESDNVCSISFARDEISCGSIYCVDAFRKYLDSLVVNHEIWR